MLNQHESDIIQNLKYILITGSPSTMIFIKKKTGRIGKSKILNVNFIDANYLLKDNQKYEYSFRIKTS